MNKFLRMVFFLFILSFLISNCNKPKVPTLIHAIDSAPTNLIPYPTNTPGEMQIYSQVYETLLKLAPDNKTILSGLAREWIYSNKHTSLTIYLKENIHFHDGTLLNSEAAKLSIYWLKRNTTSPFLDIITDI